MNVAGVIRFGQYPLKGKWQASREKPTVYESAQRLNTANISGAPRMYGKVLVTFLVAVAPLGPGR